jgi:hypothetical protein
MKHLLKHLNALFLIAFCALSVSANDQNDLKNSGSNAVTGPATCKAVSELVSSDFYGDWILALQTTDRSAGTNATVQNARLTLNRNPDFPESLSGEVSLNGQRTEVFGDIEDGTLEFEESINGKDISAIWKGKIADGSCGRAITGTRTLTANGTEQGFVMRRGGW